jgi:prolyl-tRNA editing enzyme YbaK/EbsC (Cys-tRNA(Pro) deacylase)
VKLGHSKKQIRGIMHLTYHDSKPHTGEALPAKAGEAGAPETKTVIFSPEVEALCALIPEPAASLARALLIAKKDADAYPPAA